MHTFLTVFKLWTTRAFIIRIRSLAISFLRTLCVTLSTHRRVAYYCNGVWHWHIKRLHLSARTRFRLASMYACMCRLFILLFIFVFVIVIFLKFKRHVDMIMSLKICNIFIYEHPHTYIWQQPIPCLPLSLSFSFYSLHAMANETIVSLNIIYSSHLVHYYIHNVLKMPFYHCWNYRWRFFFLLSHFFARTI